MSLSNTSNKISFTVSVDSTTEFPFTIPFFALSDIEVKVLAVSTTNEVTLTRVTGTPSNNTEFKVVANNNDSLTGGNVTIGGSGYNINSIVTIERVVPLTQEYDLQNGATIDPTALNTALDRTVAQSQQINSSIAENISFPVTDADSITYNITESPSSRANKVLGFDGSGNVNTQSLLSSGTVTGGNGIDITANQISADVDTNQMEFDSGKLKIKAGGIGSTEVANLTTADLASAAWASVDGAGTKLVGTSSSSGGLNTLTAWDGNGNLISTSATIENTTVTGGINLVPNSVAVKAYVDSFALKYSGTTINVDNISSTFADLDLSSVTGANRSLVILTVQDGDAADELFFRTKGETVVPTSATVLGMGAASCTTNDSEGGGTIILITDTSGVIQIRSGSDADLDSVAVKVMGYQKMQ
tara:strand:+ start:11964 stop:13214 length:1251 start_codon:yes stop_codon:yes gene_type:complete